MTALSDQVRVARRFQRAVRLDTDLADPDSLLGFVSSTSSTGALDSMARHIRDTRQGAFTWTGPYGAGKSSLAIAFAAALGDAASAQLAIDSLGTSVVSALRASLRPGSRGWRVLPVVGRRVRPAQAVGEALARARLVRDMSDAGWSDEDVLARLVAISKRSPQKWGGLLIFIDELGKFLEAAAQEGTDIYFFQQLAELASRSDGRLIVVGILHQSFEEYGRRLSREMRDEWAKIHGRFVDLTIAVSPDEQLEMLGRAITQDRVPPAHTASAECIAELIGNPGIATALAAAWPLHPVTACLLGPISRRRFGQNQRSVFGFLNSSEPLGFQDFLRRADEASLYTPDELWDYLRFNLEPSIMASPDGHRWAVAVDAVARCEASDLDGLHLRALKTVALVDLFRERSGLVASPRLTHTVCGANETESSAVLSELEDAKLLIYRRFSDSYGVFAGSDFDIEQAVEDAYSMTGALDYDRLTRLADFQPIVAKRHYHETGALRWFRTAVVAPGELADSIRRHAPRHGSAGTFVLALPMEGDSPDAVERHVVSALQADRSYDPVIGVPGRPAWAVASLARDLLALEYVRDHTPALHGDQVARLEVNGRITAMIEQIEHELQRALKNATWRTSGRVAAMLTPAQLNTLASDLADERFSDAPQLHSELLNRVKPSSNAVAAQNTLLRHMVLNHGEPRLGINGFPAERGLFVSLLEATGLYALHDGRWQFTVPNESAPSRLAPAWAAAKDLLVSNSSSTVSVYDIWQAWLQPPLGIKDGLLPVLTTAFMQSMRQHLALYRDGVFQSRLSDLDVQVLARSPNDVQLRWMVLPQSHRQLLADLADVVREIDSSKELADLEPIDVARALIALHDGFPDWTRRTRRLSANARLVRQLLKRAKDPNRLLFDDIPQALSGAEGITDRALAKAAQRVRDGLRELHEAFPAMLHRLCEALLTELHVPNASPPMLAELRARAENIRGLGADHREEAFSVRLARFGGSDDDMAGLVSLAVSKPPTAWTDTDVDHAGVALAELALSFVRREAFAHVKGRADGRHSMAVVVGLNEPGSLFLSEFDIHDSDQPAVTSLASRIERVLAGAAEPREDVVLAALATLSARRINDRQRAD